MAELYGWPQQQVLRLTVQKTSAEVSPPRSVGLSGSQSLLLWRQPRAQEGQDRLFRRHQQAQIYQLQLVLQVLLLVPALLKQVLLPISVPVLRLPHLFLLSAGRTRRREAWVRATQESQ